MVFQDYALFPHLSVARNVAFGLPRNASNREARVASALATVGLAGLGARTPDQLSGGQQQRVALARALAPEPEVILLDEPFSNLDADLRASVREDVREILREAGMTAVLVTHDQEEALSIADRVAVMLDGQDRPGRVAGRALSPSRQPDDRRLHRRRAVRAGRGIGSARQNCPRGHPAARRVRGSGGRDVASRDAPPSPVGGSNSTWACPRPSSPALSLATTSCSRSAR